MKGIIIYEDYRGKKVVKAVKLGVVNYTTSSSDGDWVSELSGIRKTSTQAYCNKDDTYDFEIGALIALMKMCERDKVIWACDELYKDDNYKNALQEMTENNEKLMRENNYLNYVISCRESAIESLENTRDLLINKNNELIEENEKLKLDCEKLQHGYNDMIFCGGRRNGKQYTALVNMFKKLDQKKVDAAYKEAYNTTLPVWQKEVLNQMYGVYKESKEKPELPKREEMWNDILACDCKHSKYVKVKKEDLESFVKECNEKKIFNIIGYELHLQEFWFADDSCIIEIFCKPAGFICAHRVSYVFKDTIIDYLPPMRWDLFKKGRIVVGVKNNNELVEFRKEVERNTGIKNIPMCPTNLCLLYSFDKDNYKIILESIEEPNVAKINGHKVYYWEDVR